MTQAKEPKDIDIGNKVQHRRYRNVVINIEYRPKTRDFYWYFTQTRTIRIDGRNNTIDKCVADAKKYIDKMKAPTER